MAWLGTFQRGDQICLALQCVNPITGVPTMPAICPTYQIIDGAANNVVSATKLPIVDRYSLDTAGSNNAYFEKNFLLDGNFAVSTWFLVVYRFRISSSNYLHHDHFFVEATTSDASGQIISADAIPRPEANIVVYTTNALEERQGRNPF